MRYSILFLLLLAWGSQAQQLENETKLEQQMEFTFNEYLGYVKKFHPLVKTANLEINKAQAGLMAARGAFDPKIAVDFDKKQFKDTEYYSLLNSSFKIPTWYGIEIKAGFEQNEGYYLNPQNTVPSDGLASVGISVPLGQGLFINQRMADLRKAKMQMQLGQADRKLLAIAVLYDASVAYFNWKKNFEEFQMYSQYNTNAETRFKAIQSLIKQGDKRAIDSVEAGISLKSRKLSLENSRLKLLKSKLELSNFLWLDNSIPMELSDVLFPEQQIENTIQETLKTNDLLANGFSLDNHPKISALETKIDMLEVDRKLKANALLPKIDLSYSYISEPQFIDSYKFENYKVGINFAYPIFLRKERGGLKLAQFKIQETTNSLNLERLQLSNKIKAQKEVINSLNKQSLMANELVRDYDVMLQSEERLFIFGESSLFLINSRESSLITAQLTAIALRNEFFVSNSELYKIMANPD
ncbi:MAG: TolC family protein [Flavobacteriaceae bacterium]|uniref:TolC family protein n=1 Tax=Flavobacterium kayseriense TaxID=2764714 RepID=A0ABR7J3C4_9FLAO|nr:TolC family protein [Flavobacterium kayseriense]MBC5840010.1 TolC family protein [Flavobacterium kayseriense]MBC5847320.1 TolC family protein [Flavobacterium kayseriense]MBU0940051.1 TolC family protein [Bacteroidota bacterium]MBX9887745.1 TolC family protein [Flavobacteriaceae bacterium]